MADCSWNETDHSLSSDDEIGNYQQSDFEISSTNQKSKSVGPSLEPVFMMNNSTKERITTTLSRFSILLMNGEKFSKSVRRDLEKDAKELVNVLIESPIRSDEQNQSNQSSTEFRFKITMKEKNQLIDQLIKNKDYASSESVSKKIKKDLVSNNYKLITSLFHQSLRPVDGNEIYDFNVNQSVSLNDSSSGHQETNETQSDVNPIEYLNETKDTPPKHENIWEAIRQQDLKAVDYFIRIKKIDPNLKRKDGWILLHFASEYGNLEIVKYLVSKGADINAGDIDSNLPLHWACHNGKLEIVEYFISDLKMDPNPKGNYNDTCLHIAVRSNNLELVKYLVSKGADINARNKYSNLPLSLACYYGKLEIVKYFISELRMDVNSKGFHNSTCLHHAVQSNNLELVKFLIENGAKKSLHEKNNSETTPLEGAELWNKKKELIEYLRCQMS